MKLLLVEWDEVPRYWPAIEAWVGLALRRSLVYAAPDILRLLLQGEMQLWIAADGGTVCACAVTEIRRCPRSTLCVFVVVGGRGIDEWIGFEAGIAAWAKRKGCRAIEGSGRRGWERQMKDDGYVPVFTVYRKVLA